MEELSAEAHYLASFAPLRLTWTNFVREKFSVCKRVLFTTARSLLLPAPAFLSLGRQLLWITSRKIEKSMMVGPPVAGTTDFRSRTSKLGPAAPRYREAKIQHGRCRFIRKPGHQP